ncbi:MAG: VanW family protein [Patescibacteria group bacterium]
MSLKHFVVGSLVGVGLVWGGYELVFWGKIYPGVKIIEVKSTKLVLVWGTSKWEVSPESIDLEYDDQQTKNAAVGAGRTGNVVDDLRFKIQAVNKGAEIFPVFTLDENKLIAAMASVSAQIDIPAKEPEVVVVRGKIEVTQGENGQQVDDRELLVKIKQYLKMGNGREIQIPVKNLSPKISQEQMNGLRVRAEKLVGKKVTIRYDWQNYIADDDQVISWLEEGGWKKPVIEAWVAGIAESLDRPAQNAHFRYLGSGRVEEFAPAREGVVVKQNELTKMVIDNLDHIDKNVALEIPVITTQPTIKTSAVNTLGIKERLARGESDFSGSIPNRIFNLKKAAGNMNGILVSPGETFSFNKYVGDVSAAGGYRQAYVIKEGRTVLGDGGGVCQVSTTLFRAVLNAGLPVEERTAHAYRVHYYEEGSEPGFDATIFTPDVDFKFKNDTLAYILIQTTVDEANTKLYFDLYGTSDGRRVEISKARVWDVSPPPPALYQDDPSLRSGQVRQVDFPAWGAKVAFDWKVTRGAEVLQQRTFYSNFRPWQAIYLRGTR